MEQTALRLVVDNEKCFSPKDYLNLYYKSPEDNAEEGDMGPFFLLNFHKFWTSLGSSNLTMLEFGGGPSIYPLISASPFVREIVFAEFLEANRKEVETWQRRESSSHDWSPFFKHVVQKLEGKPEEETIKREEELRSRISRIIPCDIHQAKPLNLVGSSMNDQLQFDIVSTTLCLGEAVESDSEYCEAVAKLSQLIKPGGHLVMAGVLNNSFYVVGDQKFGNFPLNEFIIRRGLEEAGIKNVYFVCSDKGVVKERTTSDFDKFFFAYGVAS